MYYEDGYLHAVVEELPDEAGPQEDGGANAGADSAGAAPTHQALACSDGNPAGDADTANNSADGDADADPLANETNGNVSRRQRQTIERKRKKQQAKQLKRRRQSETEGSAAEDNTSSPQKAAAPLRLHQFISTAFRSELNVAENGAGYFIKNAPRASAHHALLQGAVRLNGKVCKLGRTALRHGDVVSLQLEPEHELKEGELVSWRGSVDVARSLEGNAVAVGERKGRMLASGDAQLSMELHDLKDCEMVKYYREKLGKVWVPEVHESALIQPLPLTLRVLRGSPDKELLEFGFRPVTEEDVSLHVSSLNGGGTQQLSKPVMQELLRDTWILDSNKSARSEASEKRLGVFLSEAKVTGELMQQELTSMIPVAVLAAQLTKQTLSKGKDLRFLDLCAAPGSKTCQLLSSIERILPHNEKDGVDYTVIANELSPQRATSMRHRLHQQSGGGALSSLIITCADGRDYAKMESNSFDYIVCDVPCSGDGTVRKSPKILGKWSPKNAERNKTVQKELLKVGLGLLKPCADGNEGGLLVYSTCSLHPAEGEEVISEVLEELNNGGEGTDYKFSLVNLSGEDSSNCSVSRKEVLRVLPAKSHGGFFVAGMRKLATHVSEASDEGPQDVHVTNDTKHALVRRNIGTADKATIRYYISPCTQRCRTEISTRMGSATVVSSGVACTYGGVDDMQVLQQGCAALVSPKHKDSIVYINLSREEMIVCHSKRTAHREVVVPSDRLHNMTSLDPGTPVIIEVGSTFLPAKIVLEEETTPAAPSIVMKILARSQVLRRALQP